MSRLLALVFVACLCTWPVACSQHDALPKEIVRTPAIAQEPQQTPTELSPFSVHQGDVEYRIEPLFAYRLNGLVVSRRQHDGDRMLHRLWGDHLNVADICVVWGTNAAAVDLDAFDFSSGEFTCYYRTRDDVAWRAFRQDQISNNHLLSDDVAIRDAIARVEVGDQIAFSGYLARYSNAQGFNRGTSTARTDTGNGACETVFVKSFAITNPAQSVWRTLEQASLGGLVLSALAWLIGVGRGAF
jgi:hypothetical protein